MEHNLFEAKYYETYYFAFVIRNVLDNRFAYLRTLDAFYSDEAFLGYVVPFTRDSALYRFIRFVVDQLTNEEICKIDIAQHQQIARNFGSYPDALEEMRPKRLPINEALYHHSIEHLSFEEWLRGNGKSFFEASDDDVFDYYQELTLDGTSEELLDKVAARITIISCLWRREV